MVEVTFSFSLMVYFHLLFIPSWPSNFVYFKLLFYILKNEVCILSVL